MSVIDSQTNSSSRGGVTSPSVAVTRHLFTVNQYHEMIEHGIFKEDEPIELIRGEIIKKLPIGNPHAATVNRLNRLLSRQLPDEALLSIQNPIWLGNSEPEPDVAILRFREDLYSTWRPIAEDVLLLIEVYLDPQSDGRFATVITARSGDTLKPRRVAGLSIEVNAILG